MCLNDDFPERRRIENGMLSFAATAALTILFSTLAFAQLSQTGRWTPLPATNPPAPGSEANWQHLQIHMALLRGDANYHSYILSWDQVPIGSPWKGGLWGWNPPSPDDGCLVYPLTTLVKMAQPASPDAQIFCSGLAALPDGRLLVAGGTDRVGETAGIKDVRVFNSQTQTWSAEDTMAFRRYYPTNTALPDGRMLVTEGWQYDHMLTFGGRATPGVASSAQKKIERLTILDTAHWDAQVTDPGGVAWPEERAYHTAVVRRDPAEPNNEDHMRMILFGGLDTLGQARVDAWTLMRSQYYDTGELYTWAPIANGPPRARHGALVNNDHSMYVFGGIDDSTPPVAQGDVRRLYDDPVLGWQWDLKTTTGTTPGARYGHVVAHDTIPGRNRMIVFGGRNANGLADNEVYALKFSDFTWSRLDRVTGSPSPPGAREGHTLLVEDARTYSRTGGNWRRMIVYGGQKADSLTSEVWQLWIHPAGDSVEWEQLTPATPNGAPAARSGHTAIWQRPDNDNRILIFGGDTGGQSDPGVWALKLDGSQAEWIPQGPNGSALSGHTAMVDFIAIQATKPEIYDPSAAAGQRWSTINASKRYQYYPFSFVLPSGDVFLAGPQTDSYRLDLDAPQWSSALWADIWTWSAAMYEPGKILKIGGTGGNGYDTARIEFDPSNNTAGWLQANTDLVHRYLPQLTILPDGRLIATGGLKEPAKTVAARRPQIWSPPSGGSGEVGAWSDTTLAPDPAARDHHSTAILLPDGRVLTAGVSDLEVVDSEKVTIFCPPYLFGADTLATRPVISTAPDTVVWGHAFSVSSSQAEGIASAALVKPSAVTHSFNQDQRYVPLAIRDTLPGGELVLDAPAGGTWAPPGDYMLFLVDTTGVPSIARWVRVRGQAEAGECVDVTPDEITLAAPDAGRNSVLLTWTATGENGTCGTAVSYDLRRSTSAITESNFYSATRVTANLPAPSIAGSEQCIEVDSLSSCTTYRFAIKTRDAQGMWSKVSNSVTAQTDCSGFAMVICDGGGLLAGGGGAGAEESARQLSLAATGSVPGLAGSEEIGENSVLWAGAGSEVVDLHRLGGSIVESEGRYSVRLRQVGAWRAAVDRLRLGVVDHDPELIAFAGTDSVLLGTIGPVASVTDAVGGSVAGLLGQPGDRPYAGKAGDHVLVRLAGASASTALVIESRGAAARAGEISGGILVQTPGQDGSWVTTAEVHPRRQFDRCAVATGESESVRLVFLRECTIGSLAQMSVAETVAPELLALVEASHSRFGEIGDAIREAGGTVASLVPGDSLSLAFTAPARDPEKRRDFFLVARGSMEAAGAEGSSELARVASDPRVALVFALGLARPNPSLGAVAIDYTLAHKAHVDLRVYSVTGRLVRTLVNQELPAGPQAVAWDGRDDRGQWAGAGAYFYQMVAGDWRSGRKLVLLQR